MKVVAWFSILIICLAGDLFSQTDSLASASKTESYFQVHYDNDFFSATDRYYTQGILIIFIHPTLRRAPFFYVLPKLNRGAIHYYGITLEQDVFTPKSIRYNG